MENDIPPDGEGLFCDYPSNPGSCYNPESFCVDHQQYTTFCEIIREICDDGKSTNDIDSTDPQCTKEGLPCLDDYIRYGRYCSFYRIDCDSRPTSIYCDGKWRSDGLLRCNEPDHLAYKFCKRED